MVKKSGEKKKITAEIVATTSLPVDRLTATDCNAAARAKISKEKNLKTYETSKIFNNK